MKFWFITLLHLLLPKGYGFQSRLRDDPDPEKLKQAKSIYLDAGKLDWHTDKHGIKKRNYDSHEGYRIHQQAKLDSILAKGHGWKKRDIFEYRVRFWTRFRHLRSFLKRDANLLCLGARQGTEVEVLQELGFRNSSGIDFNPGPDNPLVSQGDFMDLDFPDNHLDLVYSNCLDHASDLDMFFEEQVRVLKKSGYFLMDISTCEEAGYFESQEWGRPEDVLMVALQYFRNIALLKREKRWLWVLMGQPIKNNDDGSA